LYKYAVPHRSYNVSMLKKKKDNYMPPLQLSMMMSFACLHHIMSYVGVIFARQADW
jgi:hypothetical protein